MTLRNLPATHTSRSWKTWASGIMRRLWLNTTGKRTGYHRTDLEALIRLVQELDNEETRAMREGLDEESLALFDLL